MYELSFAQAYLSRSRLAATFTCKRNPKFVPVNRKDIIFFLEYNAMSSVFFNMVYSKKVLKNISNEIHAPAFSQNPTQ